MKSMNKRILFCIPYLSGGGAERALSSITTHWPDDYEIDILANNDEIGYEYKGNIISLGVKGRNTSSVFFQMKVLIRRIWRLWLLKRDGQYEACISFIDSANFANILSGNKRCKVIVYAVSSYKKDNSNWKYKLLVNPMVGMLYRYADKIATVSEELSRELIAQFRFDKQKVVTIETGYDIEQIRLMTRDLLESDYEQLFTENPIVITVGRQTYPKRQWNLIRAFTKVLEEVPNAKLAIAGKGELEEYQKNLAAELGIADRVVFLGHIRNVYKYLSKSKVFVLPSGYEGYPNALAEAICVGLPCIVTDFHTGAREILAPELLETKRPVEDIMYVSYGVITPLGNKHLYRAGESLDEAEKKLADAIIKVLTNDEIRKSYSAKSLERSKSMGIQRIIEQWCEIIKE